MPRASRDLLAPPDLQAHRVLPLRSPVLPDLLELQEHLAPSQDLPVLPDQLDKLELLE